MNKTKNLGWNGKCFSIDRNQSIFKVAVKVTDCILLTSVTVGWRVTYSRWKQISWFEPLHFCSLSRRTKMSDAANGNPGGISEIELIIKVIVNWFLGCVTYENV